MHAEMLEAIKDNLLEHEKTFSVEVQGDTVVAYVTTTEHGIDPSEYPVSVEVNDLYV